MIFVDWAPFVISFSFVSAAASTTDEGKPANAEKNNFNNQDYPERSTFLGNVADYVNLEDDKTFHVATHEQIELLKNVKKTSFEESTFISPIIRYERPGYFILPDELVNMCAEFRSQKGSIDPAVFTSDEKLKFVTEISRLGVFEKDSEVCDAARINLSRRLIATHFCRDAMRIVASVLEPLQVSWLLMHAPSVVLYNSELMDQLTDFSKFSRDNVLEASVSGHYDWRANKKASLHQVVMENSKNKEVMSIETSFEIFCREFINIYMKIPSTEKFDNNLVRITLEANLENELMAVVQNMFKIEMAQLLLNNSYVLRLFSDYAHLLKSSQVKELFVNEAGRSLLRSSRKLLYNLPTYEGISWSDLVPLKFQAQYANMLRTVPVIVTLTSFKFDKYIFNDPLGVSWRLFSCADRVKDENLVMNAWRIAPAQFFAETWNPKVNIAFERRFLYTLSGVTNFLNDINNFKGKNLERVRSILHWTILQELKFLEVFTLISSKLDSGFDVNGKNRSILYTFNFGNQLEKDERQKIVQKFIWTMQNKISLDLSNILNGPLSQVRAGTLLACAGVMDKNIRLQKFNEHQFVGFEDWVEDFKKTYASKSVKTKKNIPHFREIIDSNIKSRHVLISAFLDKIDKALGTDVKNTEIWNDRVRLLGMVSADGFTINESFNATEKFNLPIHETIIHRKLQELCGLDSFPEEFISENLAVKIFVEKSDSKDDTKAEIKDTESEIKEADAAENEDTKKKKKKNKKKKKKTTLLDDTLTFIDDANANSGTADTSNTNDIHDIVTEILDAVFDILDDVAIGNMDAKDSVIEVGADILNNKDSVVVVDANVDVIDAEVDANDSNVDLLYTEATVIESMDTKIYSEKSNTDAAGNNEDTKADTRDYIDNNNAQILDSNIAVEAPNTLNNSQANFADIPVENSVFEPSLNDLEKAFNIIISNNHPDFIPANVPYSLASSSFYVANKDCLDLELLELSLSINSHWFSGVMKIEEILPLLLSFWERIGAFRHIRHHGTLGEWIETKRDMNDFYTSNANNILHPEMEKTHLTVESPICKRALSVAIRFLNPKQCAALFRNAPIEILDDPDILKYLPDYSEFTDYKSIQVLVKIFGNKWQKITLAMAKSLPIFALHKVIEARNFDISREETDILFGNRDKFFYIQEPFFTDHRTFRMFCADSPWNQPPSIDIFFHRNFDATLVESILAYYVQSEYFINLNISSIVNIQSDPIGDSITLHNSFCERKRLIAELKQKPGKVSDKLIKLLETPLDGIMKAALRTGNNQGALLEIFSYYNIRQSIPYKCSSKEQTLELWDEVVVEAGVCDQFRTGRWMRNLLKLFNYAALSKSSDKYTKITVEILRRHPGSLTPGHSCEFDWFLLAIEEVFGREADRMDGLEKEFRVTRELKKILENVSFGSRVIAAIRDNQFAMRALLEYPDCLNQGHVDALVQTNIGTDILKANPKLLNSLPTYANFSLEDMNRFNLRLDDGKVLEIGTLNVTTAEAWLEQEK